MSKISYPSGYEVGTRWKIIATDLLNLANYIEDPLHVAVLGMHGSPFYRELQILTEGEIQSIFTATKAYNKKFSALRDFGESDLRLPGTTVVAEGLPMGVSSSQCCSFYDEIMSVLGNDFQCRTILEVGSGFGRLARLMQLATKTECYILVDLPESLVFAYSYLIANFPNAKTYVVESSDRVDPTITSQYDFIFCPVQCLEALHLNDVDLGINTWSFGEMPQGSVDFLLKAIETNIHPAHFYSVNTIFQDRNILFESTISEERPEGCELAVPHQPIWWPIVFRVCSSLADQPNGKSVYRNGASIILERRLLPMTNSQAKLPLLRLKRLVVRRNG